MADFNPVKYKFLEPFFSLENQLNFFEKCGYKPGHGQLKVHEDLTKRRFISFSAAARFGKSLLLGSICTFGMMYPNYRIWLVGPKYDQCNKEFRWVVDLMAECKLENGLRLIDYFDVSEPKKGQKSITSKFWGSMLETKSAEGGNRNKDDLLGESLDLIGLCEGSRISIEAWTRYLYPRLGDRQGQAILPSTACEDSGLLIFFQENGQNEKKFEWGHHHFTLYDAAHFTEAEIEKARQDLPDKDFREQYLSEAISRKDKVFQLLHDHLYENKDRPEDIHDYPVVVGIKGNKNNPYVYFVLFFDPKTKVYYVEHEYCNKHVNTSEVIPLLLNECSGVHLRCVVGDIHDPEFSEEQRNMLYGKTSFSQNFIEQGKGKKESLMSRISAIQEIMAVRNGQIRIKINQMKCPYLVEALGKCTWPTDREEDQRANMELPMDLYMPAISALANAIIFVENTLS